MNDEQRERLNEELSAYLDGEAEDAEKMARLLHEDSSAARQFLEMAKLSAHLKALPGPDIHPAFATRVLARVREEAPASRRSFRWAWIAGPAVAALLIGILFGPYKPFTSEEGPAASPATGKALAERVLSLSKQPDETLTRQFAELFAEASMPAEEGSDSEDLTLNEPSEMNETAVLASISELDRDETSYPEDSDVYSQLDTLSESELQALQSLLTGNADKGV